MSSLFQIPYFSKLWQQTRFFKKAKSYRDKEFGRENNKILEARKQMEK